MAAVTVADLEVDPDTGTARCHERDDDVQLGHPVTWVVTRPGGTGKHDRVVGDHARVMAGGSLVVLDELGAIIRAYSPAAWVSVSRA